MNISVSEFIFQRIFIYNFQESSAQVIVHVQANAYYPVAFFFVKDTSHRNNVATNSRKFRALVTIL